MRKGLLLVGLVVILLMGMSVVWADDDVVREPGTPADNECNVGGVLYREENQDGCPTLWYWKAGWFLARFNQGVISREDFPKEFESVLPPLKKSTDENSGECWTRYDNAASLQYVGPANTLGNVDAFNSFDCTGVHVTGYNKVVIIFANSQPEAVGICATLGSPISAQLLSVFGYLTAPANAYRCQVS